jgi:hypothetical protein
MQLDALVLRLRVASPAEAADLGVRLCQHAARSLYPCYALAFLPLLALALASASLASWLPTLVLWWGKPWLDRTLVFVLSRAAFGQPTRPAELWAAQRQVWWQQLLRTWTLRRLSMSRGFTQPVHQLEQLRGSARSRRLRQLRTGHLTASRLLTSAFSGAESALWFALLSLLFWLLPPGYDAARLFDALVRGEGFGVSLAITLSYAAVVFFLEPFYAAAGFGMYLGRRVELEAWDIEQELRHAFAR